MLRHVQTVSGRTPKKLVTGIASVDKLQVAVGQGQETTVSSSVLCACVNASKNNNIS